MCKSFFLCLCVFLCIHIGTEQVSSDFNHRSQEIEEKSDVYEVDGIQFRLRGTKSYAEKSLSFSVTLEAAKRKVKALKSPYLKNDACRHLVDSHYLIAGDYYVFSESPSRSKLDIPYSGIWVHGETGELIVKPEYKAIGLPNTPKHWSRIDVYDPNSWKKIDKTPNP